MGYNLSWAAIRGKSPDEVCAKLALSRTGEYSDVAETPYSGAELPTDWYVVVADELPDELPELLSDCEIIRCDLVEMTMFSAAAGWKDGKQLWSVTHDSSHGLDHLETSGNLPTVVEPIVRRHQEEQRQSGDEADCLFAVPVEIAKAITGFRVDEDIEGARWDPFEILKSARDRSQRSRDKQLPDKLWWQFWK